MLGRSGWSLIAMVWLLAGCGGGTTTAEVDIAGCEACGALDSSDTTSPADGTPDAAPTCPRDLDALVACYFEGSLERDALVITLQGLGAEPAPAALPAEVTASLLVSPADAPIVVSGNVNVAVNATLVLLPGAHLALAAGATLTIDGQLLVLGATDAPVTVLGSDPDPYGAVTLTGGPNEIGGAAFEHGERLLVVDGIGATPTLITTSRFDRWVKLAISFADADGLTVRSSRFGMETALSDTAGETINGVTSGVVIEDCDFGERRGYSDVLDLTDCSVDHAPRVLHNRFHGGEDDAVDLDNCSAIVDGNLIRDFYPKDPDAFYKGVNGGGVTGAYVAQQIIVNNVIDHCYHGIGFKEGAKPILINNTIINCNIGVSLYKAKPDSKAPHGVLLNNILWNNANWTTGEASDVVLNGKWWPSYDQVDDVQGTLDARYNLMSVPYEGEGNLVGDPSFSPEGDLPLLNAGSPAVDTGLGSGFDTGEYPQEVVLDLLTTDQRGHPRTRSEDGFTGVDRGAFECW